MIKTTWRMQKEEAKKEELKAIAGIIITAILFLLAAKYN